MFFVDKNKKKVYTIDATSQGDAMNNLSHYLSKCKADGMCEGTIRHKRRILDEFFRFVQKPDNQITLDDIYDFINALQKSDPTKWNYKKNIKAYLKYTNALQITNINIDQIKNKKVQDKIIAYVTPEDYKQMYLVAKNDLERNVLSLLWETGLRVGELINLKPENVDTENKRIYLISEKSKQRDVVYYSTPIKPRRGRVIPRQGNCIREMIYRIRNRAGITKNISPHSFRHGRCMELLSAGMPLPILQKVMRHQDINSTMQYLHLMDEAVENSYRMYSGGRPKTLRLSGLAGTKLGYELELTLKRKK